MRMRVVISSDSTCDLSPELLSRYNINIVPIAIVKDGRTYFDGVDIKREDVFEHFDKTGKVCSTSALNQAQYYEHFARLKSEYGAVIHFTIGAGFSSSINNARMAAAELENVWACDPENLSSGSGHVVLEAAIMAQEGASPQEIIEKSGEYAKRVEASFVIDRLNYLHKGGRCSALAALGANIMNLKPCIEVIDGVMKVGKKYRGSYETVIMKYVDDRLLGRDDIDWKRAFVTHPACPPEIVSAVIDRVREIGKFEEIIETRAGCTVSTHCGPVTLGVLFARKKRD